MEIHQQIVDLIEQGWSPAIGLVLDADGSTPQKAGVKAAIDGGGKITGTLGGGAVEAMAQRRAVEVCRSGEAVVFDFNLEGVSAHGDGPICGGVMRVLIDPGVEKYGECFRQVSRALQERKRGVVLTTIRGEKPKEIEVAWYEENELPGDLGFPGTKEIRSCLKRETVRRFVEEKSGVEVLVEPIVPRPLLVIAGGGHVGQAIARQAALVGFDILVIDDREEFTHRELFPEGTRTVCGDMAQEVSKVEVAGDTYIVIVTRGHRHDGEVLEACIHATEGYIGMIGSTRKVGMIRKSFLESGRASEAEFNRVYTPIGLDIGAVTVPEIATSIVAQLIAVRRKGAGAQKLKIKNMV